MPLVQVSANFEAPSGTEAKIQVLAHRTTVENVDYGDGTQTPEADDDGSFVITILPAKNFLIFTMICTGPDRVIIQEISAGTPNELEDFNVDRDTVVHKINIVGT